MFSSNKICSALPMIMESPREEISLEGALEKVIRVWKSNATQLEKAQEWQWFIPIPTQELGIWQGDLADFIFEKSSCVHRHGAMIRNKISERIDDAKTQGLSWNGYTQRFYGIESEIVENSIKVIQRRKKIPFLPEKSISQIKVEVLQLLQRHNSALLESFHFDLFIIKSQLHS